MRSFKRKLPGLALVLAVSASAVPGAAQPSGTTAKPAPATTATARQLYALGEAKFKAEDYAGALANFEAADAIKPASQSARYIGICEDKLGHYVEAVAAYERFLSDVPAKLQGEIDGVKKRVGDIQGMPGHVHVVTTPPAAVLTIDGNPATGPAPLDVDLSPGSHTIHATAEGRDPADRTIVVTFASKQDVSLDLPQATAPLVVAVPPPQTLAPPPATPPPAPPIPPPGPRNQIPAIVTGGLAVVAAGLGTAFGILTLEDKKTFDKNPTESIAETGQNHALIADMSFGVAVTLGVTSIVLLLTKDEADASKAKTALLPTVRLSKRSGATLSAAPLLNPQGGGAGALLTF
jgi:hypothetical protein